jgi:hypothetical protein
MLHLKLHNYIGAQVSQDKYEISKVNYLKNEDCYLPSSLVV